MPTYEYRCKDCGHQFDAVQSFTDPTLTECPACGGLLRKVFGSVGITFKGSGFYKTDSRSTPTTADNGDKSSEKQPDKVGAGKDRGGGSDSANGSGQSNGKGSGSSGSSEAAKPKKDGKDKASPAAAAKGSSRSDSGS